jgi:DNA-directed RNA polymerase subunit RPC12/RpoP
MGVVTNDEWPSRWLLKGDPGKAPVVVDLSGLDDDPTFTRIRCPHCGWQPAPSSTWLCDGPDGDAPGFGGCGTVWNTFTTRGLCPGCDHRWRWTVCLRCGDRTLHEDWYEPQVAD